MKKSILIIVLLAITFFSAHSYAAEKDTKDKTIRIGMVTWPGNGIIFVGKEKGFFGDINVDIKVIDDMTALSNAARSGEVDMIGQATDGAAIQFGNGLQSKVVFATDVSYGGDGIVAKNEIKSVKELKGKKVGYTRANASHFLLNKILSDNGMTMDDIDGITFDDPSLAGQALFADKVDAAVTWEPFLSQASQKGVGHVIASTKNYPEYIPNVFLFSESAIAKKPEIFRQFVSGLVKSLEFTAVQHDEAVKIMAKGFNLKESEVEDSLAGMKLMTKADNHTYFCAKDPKFSVVFNEAANFWTEQKLVKTKPKDGSAYIEKSVCSLFAEAK